MIVASGTLVLPTRDQTQALGSERDGVKNHWITRKFARAHFFNFENKGLNQNRAAQIRMIQKTFRARIQRICWLVRSEDLREREKSKINLSFQFMNIVKLS